MTTAQPHYASASLYVGDLDPEVNETTLFEIFSAIGQVASIRVCRETGTRKSLGYAYVNYHSIADAERSLDTLNYTPIKGVPCRIMWSHRDPSLRRSGMGNIFVKNLDKIIDNKALHDTFSLFGNILSCKVACDDYGKSRGFGFVHYETEEAAKTAIEKIGSKTVFVCAFKKQLERPKTLEEKFTNLYVKQFPQEWTEETCRKLFEPFGDITSMVTATDLRGRRFTLVNYEAPESAKKAINALHGCRTNAEGIVPFNADEKETAPTKASSDADQIEIVKTDEELKPSEEKEVEATPSEKVPDVSTKSTEETKADETTARQPAIKEPSKNLEETLYVQRAMTKAERVSVLKEAFNTNKETKVKSSGVNLYVKNLDDQVTDADLREVFSKFGTVTSAKIMRDEHDVSKGFGFVCFAFPEEATKAVTAMHLKIFRSKPLYVGLAERRDSRIARLQQRYRMSSSRPAGGHMAQPGGMSMMQYGNPSMYYGGQGPMGGRPLPGASGPSGFGMPADPLMWRQQQQHGSRSYGNPAGPVGGQPSMTTPAYPYMGPNGLPMRPGAQQHMASRVRGNNNTVVGQQQHQQQHFKFTPQARNRQDFLHMQQHASGAVPQSLQQQPLQHIGLTSEGIDALPLSAHTLAAAQPQMQKQMLGERLFPLVHKHQPELAGKITGMMLEMDNAELLSILESDVLLQAKVDEAMGVLHRHHQGGVPPSLTSNSGAAAVPPSVGLMPAAIQMQ